jgi:ankyrin repeat protein
MIGRSKQHSLLGRIVQIVLVALLLWAGYGTWRTFRDWNFVQAAAGNNTAAVRAYLEAGVSPDVKGIGGMTALKWAAYQGNVEMVRLLLQSGAAPSRAVYQATMKGHADIVGLLLAAGGRIPQEQLDAALRVAARNGDLTTTDLLLRHGADANARVREIGDEGMTALMYAASNGSPEVIDRLLRSGADVRARDVAGRTARDHAKAPGHHAAAERLIGTTSRKK